MSAPPSKDGGLFSEEDDMNDSLKESQARLQTHSPFTSDSSGRKISYFPSRQFPGAFAAVPPINEVQRLKALRDLNVLDTPIDGTSATA